jgi:hypothetical protein
VGEDPLGTGAGRACGETEDDQSRTRRRESLSSGKKKKQAGLIVLILDRFVVQMFGNNFAKEEVNDLVNIVNLTKNEWLGLLSW